MKKLLFPLLIILLFTGCQKQIASDKVPDKIGDISAKGAAKKIEICHNGHMISINENAWPAHQAHGDLVGDCSTIPFTTICGQTWMVKNLDVSTYRNGDPIPQVTDPAEWASLTTGAWCYYLNDPTNGPIYGKLYNWYAVNDPRGLAPTGWHIPTNDEWLTLVDCLGGEDIAGGKLKETGTTHWLEPNIGATNETGFTALPANLRQPTGDFSPLFSTFLYLGVGAHWWTSTEKEADFIDIENKIWALNVTVYSFSTSLQHEIYNYKTTGYSVRCLRD